MTNKQIEDFRLGDGGWLKMTNRIKWIGWIDWLMKYIDWMVENIGKQ